MSRPRPTPPRTTYRVTATRSGDWWLLAVDCLDVVTQARRLDRAERTVRDLIATWLDVGAATIGVQIHVPELAEDVEDLHRRWRLAREAKAAAAARAREVARKAADRGMTVREIGVLLGISHQRAQQLISPRPLRRPQNTPSTTT